MDRSSRCFVLFLSLLHFITPSYATNGASTFVLGGDDGANLKFAINVPDRSDGLNFYVSGPTGNSWLAFGAGSQMKGALMFIVYPSENDPAIQELQSTSGHSEPSFTPDISFNTTRETGISNNTYHAFISCSNCRKWKGGSLDVKSKNEPWLFAVGPEYSLQSNSKQANLRQHDNYGFFTVDMVQATGDPESLWNQTSSINVTSGATSKGFHDSGQGYAAPLHALFMAGSFGVLFPLGVIYLRVLEKVMWHAFNQAFAVLVVSIGAALGIYSSRLYNKVIKMPKDFRYIKRLPGFQSKSFNSPHQIIGFIVLLSCLVQVALGILHHRIFKKTQKKTPVGMIHRWTGQIIILLGIVNVTIGFVFAGSPRHIIPFFIVVVGMAILLASMMFMKARRARRAAAYNNPHNQGLNESFPQQHPSDIHLTSAAAPPAYNAPPSSAQ
ncbi:MAG: hypothetical protein M1812_004448 [Candelaria pacifica]|nr:MAG: hypothetical protein M1812_004448 [Candelaria pacifica]